MQDCDITCKLYLFLAAGAILALVLRVAYWAVDRIIPDKLVIKIIGGNDDDGEEAGEEQVQ